MRDWREMTVATDATHHLYEGQPAYPERYLEVLKYHAPGLAPVRTAEVAWHVDPDGRSAYVPRFRRTFGFYEGRAAVEGADGWRHILPDGSALYAERYAWCGNYQGGRCPVRQLDGRYLHLDLDGRPIYLERWRYAGDYRDGIAVVQRDDGTSTHIDGEGRRVHGRWFVDLDVFHKGFARARDERGWMHVDTRGAPVYERRFAAVEPFYNGQARVEREDGGLEVIGEDGATIVELRPARRSELAALSGDMVGFWRTRTLAAMVELALPDALPGRAEEIASAIGLSAHRTARLLRAAWELGLAHPGESGRWSLTPRGELLRRGAGMDSAARMWAGAHYDAWRALGDALRDDAWSECVRGRFFRELDGEADAYHAALTRYAAQDYGRVAQEIDWARHRHVLDAGGGRGALMTAVLTAHPHLRGTVLDLEAVVRRATLPPEVAERCDLRPGDLLEPWPATADAILLARVLHDWDDDDALRILDRARPALELGGRLYVVEMVLPDDRPEGGLLDLNMLVMTGGRERSLGAWDALFAEAGFALVERRTLGAVPSLLIVEAAP